MDLGLNGRNAIVCASSKGLGYACADALASEGVNVWICARTPESLNEASEKLQASHPDVAVNAIACDVTTVLPTYAGVVNAELYLVVRYAVVLHTCCSSVCPSALWLYVVVITEEQVLEAQFLLALADYGDNDDNDVDHDIGDENSHNAENDNTYEICSRSMQAQCRSVGMYNVLTMFAVSVGVVSEFEA